MLTLDTQDAEKKLSFFRRYYYEIGFIVMAVVIAYLFVGQKELERDMRTYLITDGKSAMEKMSATSEVIRQNTEVMKEVVEVLKDNTGTLRRIEQDNQQRNLRMR